MRDRLGSSAVLNVSSKALSGREEQGAEADGAPGKSTAAETSTAPREREARVDSLFVENRKEGGRVVAALGLGSFSNPTFPHCPLGPRSHPSGFGRKASASPAG